jgi:hypothetical protein
LRSLSSSCSLNEIPRTGPRWIRFIKCVVYPAIWLIAILAVSVWLKEGSSCPYLVAETLRGNDGDLIADSLVGLEVQGQLWVVPLNDDLG